MSNSFDTPQERRQVAIGAKLLDTLLPGWYTQIDLKALNMGSGALCILGQAFGEHTEQCLAKEMYPEEFERAVAQLQTEHPEETHSRVRTWGYPLATRSMIPELLMKRGRDPDTDPNYAALRSVCSGHDNRCLWTEEIASRLAQDDVENNNGTNTSSA